MTRETRKCTNRTSVEAEGSKALSRSNLPWSCSLQQESCMAEKRASLLGKCLNRRASETPAASASSRVVVPSKPFSAKTLRTAWMIAARRSSQDNFEVDFMEYLASH